MQGTGGERDGPGLSWLTFQKGTRCQRLHLSQSDDSRSGDEAVAKTVHLAPESKETRQLPGCTQLLVQGSVSMASRGAPGFGCHCNQGIEGRCMSLLPIPLTPWAQATAEVTYPGVQGRSPSPRRPPPSCQLPSWSTSDLQPQRGGWGCSCQAEPQPLPPALLPSCGTVSDRFCHWNR